MSLKVMGTSVRLLHSPSKKKKIKKNADWQIFSSLHKHRNLQYCPRTPQHVCSNSKLVKTVFFPSRPQIVPLIHCTCSHFRRYTQRNIPGTAQTSEEWVESECKTISGSPSAFTQAAKLRRHLRSRAPPSLPFLPPCGPAVGTGWTSLLGVGCRVSTTQMRVPSKCN